jgi:hypothetical protein
MTNWTESKKPRLTVVAGTEAPTTGPRSNPAKPIAAQGSKVIRDCVVYTQSMAAFSAGFHADPTDDCDYAGERDFTKKAAAALRRLKANSPDSGPTRDVLFAKAMVLRIMFANTGGTEPEERAYARFFAAEVAAYCKGDEP